MDEKLQKKQGKNFPKSPEKMVKNQKICEYQKLTKYLKMN